MHQYFLDLDGEAPQPIYEMVLAQVEKPLIEVVLAHAEGQPDPRRRTARAEPQHPAQENEAIRPHLTAPGGRCAPVDC